MYFLCAVCRIIKSIISSNRIDILELESLLTRYVQTIDMEFLVMTCKFHTTWGELGGFKHPNALLYETSLALVNSAKSSIGHQLHPNVEIDMATYELIGTASTEIEKKEA